MNRPKTDAEGYVVDDRGRRVTLLGLPIKLLTPDSEEAKIILMDLDELVEAKREHARRQAELN